MLIHRDAFKAAGSDLFAAYPRSVKEYDFKLEMFCTLTRMEIGDVTKVVFFLYHYRREYMVELFAVYCEGEPAWKGDDDQLFPSRPFKG